MRSIRFSFIKSDGSDCKGNPNQANTTMPASFATPAFTNPKISTTTNRITSSGYSYEGGAESEGRCIHIEIQKAAGLTRRLLHLEILADPQDIEECLRAVKIVSIYW